MVPTGVSQKQNSFLGSHAGNICNGWSFRRNGALKEQGGMAFAQEFEASFCPSDTFLSHLSM